MDFTKKEKIVLDSLIKQVKNCTKHQFGYTEDSDRCGLTEDEFIHTVLSLANKGVFSYYSSYHTGQIKEYHIHSYYHTYIDKKLN